MMPASTAAMTAMPTVPAIHFFRLSAAVMWSRRSSVPGMIQALVCPTHQPSMPSRSARFMTDRMSSSCQRPARKPRAPLTAQTHTST